MPTSRARDAITLFAGALVVRAATLSLAAITGRFPEFWEHEVIARNVVAGRGFLYRLMGTDRWAYHEPVYPYLVAAVYALTDFSVLALAVVQCVVSAAIAPVTYAIAHRAFGRPAGIAAGVLVALHPALSGYATKFHPLTLDALAIALVALTALMFLDAPGGRAAAALGAATGFGTLTRPTILAFVAALILWVVATRRRRAALPQLALALVIGAAIVAPWVVRNYVRLDAFVLTRSHVGFGFWLGNHRGATGGEGDPDDRSGERSLFGRAPAELRQRVLAHTDEVSQDREFRTEAVRYVVDEPVAFAARTLKKLGYFWWFAPYFGKRYAAAEVAIYRVFYVIVLGLAVIGAVAAWRRGPQGSDGLHVTLTLLGAVSLAQALFYVQGRHRVAVEPIIITLSGFGLARLTSHLAGHAAADDP